MKDTVKKALEALAQSRGIDTSKYTDDYVLFQDLTGITSATDEFIEETLNADWYVPGGIVRPDEADSADSTDPKPEPTVDPTPESTVDPNPEPTQEPTVYPKPDPTQEP
jgi:hypothetical protein